MTERRKRLKKILSGNQEHDSTYRPPVPPKPPEGDGGEKKKKKKKEKKKRFAGINKQYGEQWNPGQGGDSGMGGGGQSN